MNFFIKNVFTPDFLYMWIRVTTPILFSALGGSICSQAGVVNLGLEGIMLMSAMFGTIGSAYGGSLFIGMMSGLAIAIILSLVFAYFHLNLKADAVLCGTAINTFATGATVLTLFTLTGEKGSSSSLKSFSFPTVQIPGVENIPVIGEIISGHNLLTYIAFICVFMVAFLLHKTVLGLRIRAAGENPDACLSVGISVMKMRYIAIILCGVLTGLGGMYMSMGYLGMFTRDMVAGRGFIALAASAMGQAQPVPVLLSTLLFSFFSSLVNTMQTIKIPSQLVAMLPYLATIIGLTIFSIHNMYRSRKRLLHSTTRK